MTALADLVAGIELLSLDAGNTIIFLDHARVAALLAEHGVAATTEKIVWCEGEAKRTLEDGATLDVEWRYVHEPGARGWGKMIGSIALHAGAPIDRVGAILEAIWPVHMKHNLWWLVPAGLGDALRRIRRRVKIALVSNSEGALDLLFTQLGIFDCFDVFLDSGKIGIEKPDRRIFDMAYQPFGIAPDRVLHLGDTPGTDSYGALAVGMRTALIDPHGFYAGRHASIARVEGVVAVAKAIE